MSELRGLGEVNKELDCLGGRVLAISSDSMDDAFRSAERHKIGFSLLSDSDADVISQYGLLHEGGGPGGSDVAVPAIILINGDGKIAWRYVAPRIQDRLAPSVVLEAVRRLDR